MERSMFLCRVAYPLLILAAVLAAYGNSFSGAFQFSDYNVIVDNPAVHSWEGWLETARQLGIRPLLKLTYTLSWLSGLGVFGFHLFNVAVHGACCLVVYALSRRVLTAWGVTRDREALPALLTAMLFALHPVHTEAVTYISGRSSSLMALLFLASLLAYVRGTEGDLLCRVLSPVLFLASVAVKEVAVTLPLALLLWERMVVRRPWKAALTAQAAHWLLLALVMGVIFTHPKYLSLLLFSSELRGIQDNLISQIDGVGYLLSRLLLVNDLNIDPDIRPATGMTAVLWLKALLMAGAAAAAFKCRHTRPWLLFALLWFLVALLPSNSLFARLDVVNERHMYLADMGILLAVGCETALLRWGRRTAVVVTTSCLAFLTVFTVIRNYDYRSEIALWESTVRRSPHKARGYNNLGCAYEQAGMIARAAAAYGRALVIDPFHENARLNLARLKQDGRQ